MVRVKRLARRAWFRSAGRYEEWQVDETTSAVMAAFYELRSDDRPANLGEFDNWAFNLSRKVAGSELRLRNRERFALDVSDGIKRQNQIEGEGQEAILTVLHTTLPTQENYVYFRDVLRHFAKLPRSLQNSLIRLARAESIVGYAKDAGVDLFTAMDEQARLREVFRRLMDDDANEKKEAVQ